MAWLINEPTSNLFYTQMKYDDKLKDEFVRKAYESKTDKRRVGDRLWKTEWKNMT